MKLSRSQFIPFLLPLTLSLLIAFLSAKGFLSRYQEQALDWQFRWRGVREPPREVAVVAIDDASVMQVGRWQWRRSLHAELARKLSRAGAKVIAFDIVFAESTPDDDELAQAAKQAGNVFFAMYFSRKPRGVFAGYAPTVLRPASSVLGQPDAKTQNARRIMQLPFAEGAVYPAPSLRQAAAGVGHVNVFPELDGVLRRTPLFIAHKDGVSPSLPLAVTQYAIRNTDNASRFTHLPINKHGELLLNFYGGYQTFQPYHSAYKVLRVWDEKTLRDHFQDRIILIGVTAAAAADLHATPFTPRCPGVEAHTATAVGNLLRGEFLRPASSVVLLLLVMLCGGMAGVMPLRLRTGWSAVAMLGLLTGIVTFSVLLFQRFNLWLDFVAPLLTTLSAYGVSVLYSLRLQERERIRAQERMAFLQQLSEMKSEYVSIVSHELKTPLTSILGLAGTLQRDTQGHFDEKTKQECYAMIHHESHRLLRLINEQLDVARLEAGRKLSVDLKEVDVKEAVTKAVSTQQFYGQARHVFDLQLPPDLPPVKADPDRLEQILLNLLSNAVKYSPAGGTITIIAQTDTQLISIHVKDEGMGITAEQRTQLFQPYQRLDSAQVAKIRGTGLGLYLTKALVEAQGGRIGVESEGEGKGSTFSFTLPIATQRREGAKQTLAE